MVPASTGSSFSADIGQDLRVATRRMRRAPALAAAIALTIGLGLGAAAAIFTAAEAALVEPLPYAEPDRLVLLWEARTGTEERSRTSYPTLLDWRSRVAGFSALEGYDSANFTVGLGDEARMRRGAQVTAGFFRLLGVRMSAGRDFLPVEDATAAGVAIVSEGLARSVAGGTALETALDRTITINGTPHVVVGVLPDAFHFALLQNADVFVPLVAGDRRRTDRFDRSVQVVGRLRDDVSLAGARAELSAVMSELAGEHPDALGGRTVAAAPLRDALLGNVKPILTSLLVAVALLVVIMGANLALLTLTRYVERAPELAVRSALGATRARILRQLLVEGLVPSVVGAGLAVAIGQVASRALLGAIPEGVRIGMPYLADAGLDAEVIAAISALTTVLAIGFGVGPALFLTKVRGRAGRGAGRGRAGRGAGWGRVGRLRAGDARTTLSRGDRRLRRGLVLAQMALTVVLLVSAGLFVMSFRNLVDRDLGFRDPKGLVTLRAPLSGNRYQEPVAQHRFYEALLARSAALPGVLGAGLIDEVPGGGGRTTTFEPVDRPLPASEQPRAALRIVGGEYFATMGIPVVAGRAFEAGDGLEARRAAVVSASLARRLAAEAAAGGVTEGARGGVTEGATGGAGAAGVAVGRRLRLGNSPTEWEIVGVVGDVQVAALDTDSPPVVYLSHLQAAENRMMLVLRTELGVASVANEVRAIVRSLDAGVPVYAVSTLDRQLIESRAVFSRRFPMILCGVFAAAALALTLVALHAICAHEVVTRRREFGVRIALGGTPGSIRRLILGDAILLGAVGIGVGVMVATLVSRSMQAVLFGVTPTDWRVYGVVAVGVLVSALVATLRPALRAGSVSPGVVMREE